jgi:hypothetical protein
VLEGAAAAGVAAGAGAGAAFDFIRWPQDPQNAYVATTIFPHFGQATMSRAGAMPPAGLTAAGAVTGTADEAVDAAIIAATAPPLGWVCGATANSAEARGLSIGRKMGASAVGASSMGEAIGAAGMAAGEGAGIGASTALAATNSAARAGSTGRVVSAAGAGAGASNFAPQPKQNL